MNINRRPASSEIKILIVEESLIQAGLLKDVFFERDYKVRTAVNGKEALGMVREDMPDLIISNVNLPVIDGFGMCNEIKNDEALKHIPVMLIIKMIGPDDILRIISVNANDYIIEPYENDYVVSKAESLLIDRTQQKDESHDEKVTGPEGEEYNITANRQEIIGYLISTCKNTIHQNRKLVKARAELKKFDRRFESKVLELEAAQANLRASEEKFRSFVQMLPDFVYQIDADGRFTFVNDAVKNLGYIPEELIGRHFGTLVVPTDVKNVNRFEVLEKHITKQEGSDDAPKLFDERRTGDRGTKGLEVRIIPKGGGEGTRAIIEPIGKEMPIVEINSSGLYEDNINTGTKEFIGSVGVIRDITERKQVEKKKSTRLIRNWNKR